MTDLEFNKKAFDILAQLRDKAIADEAIIDQIKEFPEFIAKKLPSGSNLFLSAVLWDRFPVAMALSDMGADIHWTSEASIINGNALNVAHSPQQADQLLALGIEIERNLLISKPILNPAIAAAEHNDTTMLFYWLNKERELFTDDAEYVQEVYYAAIDMVSMMNQYNMLGSIMVEDELFDILKDIYSKVEDASSIRLYLRALGYIEDKNLDSRKKELKKILNARKKELSSNTVSNSSAYAKSKKV